MTTGMPVGVATDASMERFRNLTIVPPRFRFVVGAAAIGIVSCVVDQVFAMSARSRSISDHQRVEAGKNEQRGGFAGQEAAKDGAGQGGIRLASALEGERTGDQS